MGEAGKEVEEGRRKKGNIGTKLITSAVKKKKKERKKWGWGSFKFLVFHSSSVILSFFLKA